MANDGVNEPVNTGRRRFLTATTAVVGAVGVGFLAVPFIKSWNPSAKARLAGAPVTADLTGLQEGQRLVLEWRGQPIWIVKRSQTLLDALPGLDGRLRDPQSTNADQQPAYVLKGYPEFTLQFNETDALTDSQRGYAEAQLKQFDTWYAAWSKQGGAVQKYAA